MTEGQKVMVKEGASAWMKEHNFWADYLGDNIDGKVGTITGDYTHLPGNMSHFAINLGLELDAGVHPDFVINVG